MKQRATRFLAVCLSVALAALPNLRSQEPSDGDSDKPSEGKQPVANSYKAWLSTPDGDGDGLPDSFEKDSATDPEKFDTDGDGVADGDVFADVPVKSSNESLTIEYLDFDQYAIDTAPITEDPEGDSEEGIKLHWRSLRKLAAVGAFSAMKPLADPDLKLSGRLEFGGVTAPHRAYRTRGWITAPVTGPYKFWIAADDEAELWLSEDSKPFNKRQIARGVRWLLPYNWASDGIQESENIELVAGEKYYFEVRWAQKLAACHFAVAWATDSARPAVIGQRYLEPYRPVAEDADDNGLSDDWEKLHQLSGGSADTDSDGDGLNDLTESQLGSNPKSNDSKGLGGVATWEKWRGIDGVYVFDMTAKTESYPTKPDEIRYLSSLETPQQLGDNYGSRIRGQIKVPDDGYYTFWISSDDHSELWLSNDESSLGRRRVARVVGYTGWRDYFRFPEQRSTARFISAGKVLYFEVLHKEAGGEDHLSVAWSRSDEFFPDSVPQPIVIGGSDLISWSPEESDQNDNGLPDAWERSKGLPENVTAYHGYRWRWCQQLARV